MYKLLVADDEEKLLVGLCSYYPWKDLGFEIVAKVRNGKEALSYVEAYPVDVILSDISMSEMTGIELAEVVQKQYPDIIIVFLSGYADFRYAQKAMSYGVREYILKPVKTDEIKRVFTAIKETLDFKRQAEKEPAGYYVNVIDRINHYISVHLSDASLERAAELVNLNANYVSTLYKQRTGRTFSEMLLRLRMEEAEKLLSKPELKIYQIADTLGYENAKNFSRAFRSYFGYSPRDLRISNTRRE